MDLLLKSLPTVSSAFLATLVEAVEALTVVLAVAATRGLRPALQGSAAGVILLILAVMLFGPALQLVPLRLLQAVVGGLALLVGLKWLRKAVLRAVGRIALHDEAAIFAKTSRELAESTVLSANIDWLAFLTAFKIILLEGFEVVLIVLALAAQGEQGKMAALGATSALIVVSCLGVVLHRPLTRVPENSLKLTVGIMMCAFGLFWLGESSGFAWPGDEWSLIGLMGGWALAAAICIILLRREVSHAELD